MFMLAAIFGKSKTDSLLILHPLLIYHKQIDINIINYMSFCLGYYIVAYLISKLITSYIFCPAYCLIKIDIAYTFVVCTYSLTYLGSIYYNSSFKNGAIRCAVLISMYVFQNYDCYFVLIQDGRFTLQRLLNQVVYTCFFVGRLSEYIPMSLPLIQASRLVRVNHGSIFKRY